jgi:dihydroxyacetone kinase-like protein
MANYPNSEGRRVVLALIDTIEENKAFLSEVDGKIGDGDHGINMAKGFALIRSRLGDREVSLSEGLGLIGKTLITEIGGAMGPIYGTLFIQMSLKSKDKPQTDAALFGVMLKAAREALYELGGAKVGDKTIMDTLIPAQESYQAAVDRGASLQKALRTIFSHVKPLITGLYHTRYLFWRAFSASHSFYVDLGLRDGPKPARRLP